MTPAAGRHTGDRVVLVETMDNHMRDRLQSLRLRSTQEADVTGGRGLSRSGPKGEVHEMHQPEVAGKMELRTDEPWPAIGPPRAQARDGGLELCAS